MQCQLDTVLFAMGKHRPDQILVICPQLVSCDFLIRGHKIRQVKAGYQRTATLPDIAGGTQPADMRHKVKANGGNAQLFHNRQHFESLFDALVPLFITGLNVVVKLVGHRLNDNGGNAKIRKALVHLAPMGFVCDIKIRGFRQANDTVLHPALPGKIPGDILITS